MTKTKFKARATKIMKRYKCTFLHSYSLPYSIYTSIQYVHLLHGEGEENS